MGHVITFAQQKGGAGKTTLLAHLAASWAEAGRQVAILDLDPQQSLTRWAALRADPAITLVESKDYRATLDIKTARKSFDFVLIDCPGAASTLLENAIRESDLVIAPCQPSVMDVWALGSVVTTAAKARRPLRILLNRMPARHGSLDEVLAELGELPRAVAGDPDRQPHRLQPGDAGRPDRAGGVAPLHRRRRDLRPAGRGRSAAFPALTPARATRRRLGSILAAALPVAWTGSARICTAGKSAAS